MMSFSIGTGLERVGCWASPLSLDVGLLCKNKKQRRIGGGSPVTSPMPKSAPSRERKDQLFKE